MCETKLLDLLSKHISVILWDWHGHRKVCVGYVRRRVNLGNGGGGHSHIIVGYAIVINDSDEYEEIEMEHLSETKREDFFDYGKRTQRT